METKTRRTNDHPFGHPWEKVYGASGRKHGGSVVRLELEFGTREQKGIIAVDVDQVVADLHDTWLERYNKDYDDHVTVWDIVDWDITKFVKPECGNKIFDYLNDPTLYEDVIVIEGALAGVEHLKSCGYRVVYATSCHIGMHDAKWMWLVEEGFLPKANTQKDLISLSDKALVRADYLIDDRALHIHNFVRAGGEMGFLFDAPHNHANTDLFRVKSWADVVRYF